MNNIDAAVQVTDSSVGHKGLADGLHKFFSQNCSVSQNCSAELSQNIWTHRHWNSYDTTGSCWIKPAIVSNTSAGSSAVTTSAEQNMQWQIQD